MGSPTGGPKDEDPPVPLKSKPVNYSRNFKDDKIIILFDEYVTLNNINQELLVSPPLEEKPKVTLRGKNVLIKLLSELEDSTTYNFNFYSALADLHEGNILENFMFEVSTGPDFDSLYVSGNTYNAYNFKPQEKMLVMLYPDLKDSTPRTDTPAYIAKTNAEGQFYLGNLKDKPYYAFALEDLNSNMKFDLPNEKIAFIDSSFRPSYTLKQHIDSIHYIDTIIQQDTIWKDSTYIHDVWETTIPELDLLFFQEDYSKQYFKESYRNDPHQVILAFQRELSDSFSLACLTPHMQEPWYIKENIEAGDSVVLWLTDSLLYKADSLELAITYLKPDSLNQMYLNTDTLLIRYAFEDKNKSGKRDKKGNKKDDNKAKPGEQKPEGEDKPRLNFDIAKMLDIDQSPDEEKQEQKRDPSPLSISHNLKSGLDVHLPITLTSNYPLKEIMTQQIHLYQIVDDTVYVPQKFIFHKDSLNIREYTLSFKREEEEKYQLILNKGAFTDIYENVNDSVAYSFLTKSNADYATMILHMHHVADAAVIQLWNEKETELVREFQIHSDTTIQFSYLKPQKGLVKLFYDENQNGKWDTGNFALRKQPEKVFYFRTIIEFIASMEYEYDWDLNAIGK